MIGERTNVTGSKKFARLVKRRQLRRAVEVALEQVRGGANIIDVNMDEGMLDSEQAMTTFLNYIATEPEIARVPVMIDSSKWSVIEAGLKCVQGKAGRQLDQPQGRREDFLRRRTRPRYGAGVVVMAFDETGPGRHGRAQGAICQRAYRLLTSGPASIRPTSSSTRTSSRSPPGLEEHNDYAINFIEATRRSRRRAPA
jgi:5-methyltetrahydrofolate--homocysteine methyltransferase